MLNVLDSSGRKIVNYENAVSLTEQCVSKMGSDEAGAAGDKDGAMAAFALYFRHGISTMQCVQSLTIGGAGYHQTRGDCLTKAATNGKA